MKHIHMKRSDAEKWLKALRSGEYQQGNGMLKTIDGRYCCLGVLQHCLTGAVETLDCSEESEGVPSYYWLSDRGILFFNRLGYNNLSPYLSKLDSDADVANDSGVSFQEIADAIEDELEYID